MVAVDRRAVLRRSTARRADLTPPHLAGVAIEATPKTYPKKHRSIAWPSCGPSEIVAGIQDPTVSAYAPPYVNLYVQLRQEMFDSISAIVARPRTYRAWQRMADQGRRQDSPRV